MAHCILYQNPERNVTLIDIPRSIELAQGRHNEQDKKRILSCPALEKPFTSIEPRSKKALANQITPSVEDLILQRHLQIALEEVQRSIFDKWCFPRMVPCDNLKKRGQADGVPQLYPVKKNGYGTRIEVQEGSALQLGGDPREPYSSFFQNHTSEARCEDITPYAKAYIPPMSTAILGDIDTTFGTFISHAPNFDLVVLDPPWPNRSARRKKSYNISYGTKDITALLSSIRLSHRLNEEALVGIWITNKPAFRNLILSAGGIFDHWNVELVEEWIWLKVTSEGAPICSMDSTWRKPYEILLVGRKTSKVKPSIFIEKRIIFAVPDLHSRKPNLKALFEPLLPTKYQALEIFARNLTAGWWAWGNEVMKFQHEEQWIDKI